MASRKTHPWIADAKRHRKRHQKQHREDARRTLKFESLEERRVLATGPGLVAVRGRLG